MKLEWKKTTLALLGIATLLTGCVSGTIQKVKLYPEPEPGKGLVYFYRESKIMGGGVSYNIKEGDVVLGPCKNGTYFFVQASPGRHTYTASTEASSSRTIEVEAGKTYYIECSAEIGLLTGRPALKIVIEAEGKSVLPGLKYITK